MSEKLSIFSRALSSVKGMLNKHFYMFAKDWFICQGEWILSGRDGCCDDSKLVRLYMYGVKCENIGTSRDVFLTQVSDFAVLFGNELDAEASSLGFSESNIMVANTIFIT